MPAVLVVEDHAMVREALAKLLAGSGRFRVAGCAGTVEEALVLVRRSPPDVVMADLSLGNGNALDLLRALARAGRRIPTLVMAEFPGDFSAEEALGAGAAGHIFKERPTGEILRALEEVAAGRRYLGTAVSGRRAGARRGAA
ncbi:MAG TPA: response regulator [Polyangia bacterium]|nr:response regulator [Polyangia bacterium]